MSKISGYIKKIRTAVFGVEIRGALADGLQAVNDETEATAQRQEQLRARYDTAVAAHTVDAEVIDARVDQHGNRHANLKTRLDMGTADRLTTPRRINGVEFDGTANIEIDTRVPQIEITDWDDLHELLVITNHRRLVNVYSIAGSINGPHIYMQGTFTRFDNINGFLELVHHENRAAAPVIKYFRRFGRGEWGEWVSTDYSFRAQLHGNANETQEHHSARLKLKELEGVELKNEQPSSH